MQYCDWPSLEVRGWQAPWLSVTQAPCKLLTSENFEMWWIKFCSWQNLLLSTCTRWACYYVLSIFNMAHRYTRSLVFKVSLGLQKSVFLILKPYKTGLKLLRKKWHNLHYLSHNWPFWSHNLPWKFRIICNFLLHPIRRPDKSGCQVLLSPYFLSLRANLISYHNSTSPFTIPILLRIVHTLIWKFIKHQFL